MLGILVRTLVIYLILMGAMRLMGKRQIGELEVSDLITTLLLSEIATLPIENPDVPVLHAVVPIVTLVTLEVCMATLLCRFPFLRKKLEAPPSMLICRGQLNQSELIRNRLSVEELFAGLRQQGIGNPGEVEYAIMEKNGNLSVIPKKQHTTVTLKDMKLDTVESGIMHVLVSDGKVNDYNLKLLERDEAWLEALLEERKAQLKDVLYLMCNDVGEVELVRKEKLS